MIVKLPNDSEYFEYDGLKYYVKNCLFHREDGPAIQYPNGDKKWYINGYRISCSTQEEFERLMKLRAFW
jgi:hypothetical protein